MGREVAGTLLYLGARLTYVIPAALAAFYAPTTATAFQPSLLGPLALAGHRTWRRSIGSWYGWGRTFTSRNLTYCNSAAEGTNPFGQG